jgi:hypothetical protein
MAPKFQQDRAYKGNSPWMVFAWRHASLARVDALLDHVLSGYCCCILLDY